MNFELHMTFLEAWIGAVWGLCWCNFLNHSFSHSFIFCSFIDRFVHTFVRSFIFSFICSFIDSLTHSLIHLFTFLPNSYLGSTGIFSPDNLGCDPVQLQRQVLGKVLVQRLGEVPDAGADAEVRFRTVPVQMRRSGSGRFRCRA